MFRSPSDYLQENLPQICRKTRANYRIDKNVLKTMDIINFAVEAVCSIGSYNVNITDLFK
jgi:hypothetical protein